MTASPETLVAAVGRRPQLSVPVFGLGVLVATLIGELLFAGGFLVEATLVHAGALLILVNLALVDGPRTRLASALTLVPTTRLLSLVAFVPTAPPSFAYLTVGVPLAAAALYGLSRSPSRQPIVGETRWRDMTLAFAGVPLGLLSYGLGVIPAEADQSLPIGLPILIAAIVVTAFAEEAIYRGLILSAAAERYGSGIGIVLSAGLYATMHLGHLSVGAVVVALIGAIVLGLVVVRRGALLPAIGAHVVWSITAYGAYSFMG